MEKFGDDIFALWNHSPQELHKFSEFMNSIDTSGKIKFTMSVTNNNSILEFLDLGLHIKEDNKICLMRMPNQLTILHMFYHQLAIPKKALIKFLKRLH